jgi:ankyrin repeat protein
MEYLAGRHAGLAPLLPAPLLCFFRPYGRRYPRILGGVIQPDELKHDRPLIWSTGTGTDVWALFCATIAGDLAAVQGLVQRDPTLVRCHYAYRTPIYFAVRENQLAIAEHLLDRGADPLSLAVNDSMLEICSDRGYGDMRKLLEGYFTKSGSGPSGEAVAAAIRERDLAKMKRLLDASPELLHAGDERSNQPIHWAVMTRQLDAIDELLARGADINAARVDGARPIQLTNGDYHYRGWRDVPSEVQTTPQQVLAHLRTRGAYVDICTAAHTGDLDRVRELLDQDPSLGNRVSSYVTYYLGSGSPLKNAAARGHMDIVKLLLDRGADPNLPEEGIAPNGHALYSAVYNGHYEVAKLLLEKGAIPNAPVESSADALSIAMSRNDDKMVDLLCSYGAARSLDLLSYYGDVRTASAIFAVDSGLANDPDALGQAASNGHDGFVRLMLRHQPDLAKRMAVAAKTRVMTEWLFERGMDPNHRDWLGVTRLHEFARRGDVENAALFLDHGADTSARDEDICSTPLGWAAKFVQAAMVDLLLDRGARPNLPDDLAWATPLAWATRRGHADIAARLTTAS